MQLITWQDVAAVALSFTGIVAVLGWVAKKLFEQFLAARLDLHRKGLAHETEELKARLQQANALEIEKLRSTHAAQTESHKATLQREGVLELERVRSSLRREHFEHELRLSELQKRRADVIEGVYARFSRVVNSLGDALRLHGSNDDRPERLARAIKEAQSFEEYFDEKRVMLPTGCCDLLDKFKTVLRTAVLFGTGKDGRFPTGTSRVEDDIRERMTAAWSSLENDVPPIRRELEREMRQLLGDPVAGAGRQAAGDDVAG